MAFNIGRSRRLTRDFSHSFYSFLFLHDLDTLSRDAARSQFSKLYISPFVPHGEKYFSSVPFSLSLALVLFLALFQFQPVELAFIRGDSIIFDNITCKSVMK